MTDWEANNNWAYLTDQKRAPRMNSSDKEKESKEVKAKLEALVEKSKAFWDSQGKPYPPHLQSAIDFLKKYDEITQHPIKIR